MNDIPFPRQPTAKLFEELVDGVIGRMLRTPGRQSGDDSRLTDIWLEYADQVQGQHSVVFHFYEDLLDEYCEAVCKPLSPVEIAHLFYHSEAAKRWADDPPAHEAGIAGQDVRPDVGEMRERVVQELRRRVDHVAMNLELPGGE